MQICKKKQETKPMASMKNVELITTIRDNQIGCMIHETNKRHGGKSRDASLPCS